MKYRVKVFVLSHLGASVSLALGEMPQPTLVKSYTTRFRWRVRLTEFMCGAFMATNAAPSPTLCWTEVEAIEA